MSILVLGHGKFYKEPSYVRCSPIPVSEWYYKPHISVDMDPEIEPDVIHDLRTFPWPFEPNSFDLIVDTCGLALERYYTDESFMNEIHRLLTPNGVFEKRKKPTFLRVLHP